MVYKFNPNVGAKPCSKRTELFEKAGRGEALNREEKDLLACYCYGLFGSTFAGVRLGGWIWSISENLQEYIVESKDGVLSSYFAADKTSLRKALREVGTTITRIMTVTGK